MREPSRTEDAAKRIAEYVLGLPESENSVSRQAIFAAIGIKLALAIKVKAMAAAMTTLREHAYQRLEFPWAEEGRSLKRRAA